MQKTLFASLFYLLASITGSIPLNSQANAQAPTEISWQPLSHTVHLGIARLTEYGFVPGEISLIRVSTEHFSPQIVRAVEYGRKRASVSFLSQSSNSPICINSSFFDKSNKPLGLVVSRGIKHSSVHRGGSLLTGIFASFKGKHIIKHRNDTEEGYGLEAVQAGPRLVVKGETAPGLDENGPKSRRSGICITKNKQLMLFALTSALRGASLYELAKILTNPKIGCQEALNFDGGGSSQFYVSPDLPGSAKSWEGLDLQGRDNIPVALCLHPNKINRQY